MKSLGIPFWAQIYFKCNLERASWESCLLAGCYSQGRLRGRASLRNETAAEHWLQLSGQLPGSRIPARPPLASCFSAGLSGLWGCTEPQRMRVPVSKASNLGLKVKRCVAACVVVAFGSWTQRCFICLGLTKLGVSEGIHNYTIVREIKHRWG